MKNRLKLFFAVICVSLISCSSQQQEIETKVIAVIYPVHSEPSDEKYWSSNKEYVYSHVDLDGNQYVTRWSARHANVFDAKTFRTVRQACSVITNGAYPVDLSSASSVGKEDLLYKEVVLCISRKGYKLDDSRAHSPEMVVIQLKKSYSSYGERVGAGGRVAIFPKGLEMADILPSARDCYTEVRGRYHQGEAGGLIYINMGPVVDGFSSCLSAKGFTVFGK